MPFLLFDSIINYFTFIQIYGILFKFREDMPDSGKASAIFSVLKRFERQVFKNMSSRDRCFRLLHAFIDDTKPMPVWFQKSISEFEDLGLPKTQNPIHMVMRKMDPSHVRAVQEYALTPFSSQSENLHLFFAEMFQKLMDVYVVCKMLSEPPKDVRIFLASESHVQNVLHMLSDIGVVRGDATPKPYTINVKDGVIDIANSVPLTYVAING
jgi:hypothetical protein